MSFPYSKAMVTGGAGFIGSHIVEALLELCIEVVSIDNYSAGKSKNLMELPNRNLLTEVNCDVTDYQRLKQYFDGVEIVFHNAASKKTICLNDPRRDLQVNAEGTFNILELCYRFGVKKVVHASTGSVYGEAQYVPQDERHPLQPTSYYGVSKLAGERYTLAFANLYGLNVSVLRYFHVYGPRQENSDVGGVVAIFCHRALNGKPMVIYGDGTQVRSFTYVKDVVNANLLVASDDRTFGEVYNCASGINITIKKLAEKIGDCAGLEKVEIEYKGWTPGDIKIFNIDNSKLKALGFEFTTDFSDGIEQTFFWYKSRSKQIRAQFSNAMFKTN